MLSRRRKKILAVSIATIIVEGVALVAVIIFLIRENFFYRGPDPVWGVTFSAPYARELGLDWKKTFLATLDDLHVRTFRIGADWDVIEPQPDLFDFSEYDWMLDEAGLRGAHVILGVGRRLPRWPECHVPAWAKDLPEPVARLRVLNEIKASVLHFKNHGAISYWQVENEPLLNAFGICPDASRAFLREEVALVRSLDNRPIILTESGELSTWLGLTGIADRIGISLYRVVWNRFFGYFYYPLTPGSYKKRADVIRALGPEVFVSELQTEAWGGGPLTELSLAEQYRSMDVKRFKSNVEFARRAGFPEVYLWGVEWWYWLREIKGDPAMWDAAKSVFSPSPRGLPAGRQGVRGGVKDISTSRAVPFLQ